MQRATPRLTKAHIQMLTERFGLTVAEGEIALLLSAGETVKTIAEIRDRTMLTVRTQIKRAMHKMDVHRQVDLVRLVLQTLQEGARG